jgi:hypothetical protein
MRQADRAMYDAKRRGTGPRLALPETERLQESA